jgi:hypothetical protein
MTIQRTVYAVTVKSHDSLFERIYHVLSSSGLNAGEKALFLAEKEYRLSSLYVEKTPIVCYLDGLIESSGEAEMGEEERKNAKSD